MGFSSAWDSPPEYPTPYCGVCGEEVDLDGDGILDEDEDEYGGHLGYTPYCRDCYIRTYSHYYKGDCRGCGHAIDEDDIYLNDYDKDFLCCQSCVDAGKFYECDLCEKMYDENFEKNRSNIKVGNVNFCCNQCLRDNYDNAGFQQCVSSYKRFDNPPDSCLVLSRSNSDDSGDSYSGFTHFGKYCCSAKCFLINVLPNNLKFIINKKLLTPEKKSIIDNKMKFLNDSGFFINTKIRPYKQDLLGKYSYSLNDSGNDIIIFNIGYACFLDKSLNTVYPIYSYFFDGDLNDDSGNFDDFIKMYPEIDFIKVVMDDRRSPKVFIDKIKKIKKIILY